MIINEVRDLDAIYDARKSFYGKAKVEIRGEKDDPYLITLYSYGKKIASITVRIGKMTVVHNMGTQTTRRHFREFCRQFGFDSIANLSKHELTCLNGKIIGKDGVIL